MDSTPTFIILGAAGDGKSSIVRKLADPNVKQVLPESGRNPNGVTKNIRPYNIMCQGKEMLLVDTMGIGDENKGISDLIAGLQSLLLKPAEDGDSSSSASEDYHQVHGIIVTNLIISSRLGLACQILQQIIKHGLVKDSNGISPWERIIICGTKRDRCDKDEIQDFQEKTGPHFFTNANIKEPKKWQITTSSVKEEDGMNDLMQCMADLFSARGQSEVTFVQNLDTHAICKDIANLTNGDPELQELELKMKFAWTEVMRAETRGTGEKQCANAIIANGTQKGVEQITSEVGKEVITQYGKQQAATGLGSGVLKNGAKNVALTKGFELEVGQVMMDKACKETGEAVLLSSSGKIVTQVGVKTVLTKGAIAGTHFSNSIIATVAQVVASSCGASNMQRKIIGAGTQMSTAGIRGFIAGGPAGAGCAVAVGLLAWTCQEYCGELIERVVASENSEVQSAWAKYYKAKEAYEKANKKKENDEEEKR